MGARWAVTTSARAFARGRGAWRWRGAEGGSETLPYVSAIQPKISRQLKRQITRLITSENGSSAGQSGGAGADGGPVGFRNGGADVLDALRAEDGTEAAGGG